MSPPTPQERLLAAVGELVDTAATAALSHCDLHAGGGLGKALDGIVSVAKQTDPTAIAVSTTTKCEPAATGTQGQVRVGVAAVTAPMPLAPTVLKHVVPGQLPTSTCTASQPQDLAAGADHVMVSISPTQLRGSYVGLLCDQANAALHKPVVIYLDGLP